MEEDVVFTPWLAAQHGVSETIPSKPLTALQLERFQVCQATAEMFRHTSHTGANDGTLLLPRQQCSLRMPNPDSVMQR
jgi:hypothetical protein